MNDSTPHARDSRPRALRVGDWWVRPEEGLLVRGDEQSRLRPRSMDVLVLLASRPDQAVSKQEILEDLWQGRAVEDGALARCISEIRGAMGDSPREARYIETVPKRGYRVVADVGEAELREAGIYGGDVREAGIYEGDVRKGSDPSQDGLGGASVPAPEAQPPGSIAAPAGGPDAAARPAPALIAALCAALLLWGLGSLWRASTASLGSSRVIAGTPSEVPRLVVLPFTYLGADPGGVYLADGLTAEVTTELVRAHGDRLAVIGRATAARYRDPAKSTAAIALELEVGWVLAGSVVRDGDRIRVSTRLVGADDVHRWANQYDRQLRHESLGQLEVQADIADTVVRAVALNLGLVEKLSAAGGESAVRRAAERSAPPSSLARAHRDYLEGLGRLPPATWDSLEQAEQYFRRAVEIEPSFADGWLGLATSTYHRIVMSDAAGVEEVRGHLGRALALDEGLPHAHRLRAMLLFYIDWDREGARAAWQRSLELAPHLAEAHHDLAAYYSAIGDHRAALDSVHRAYALNPGAPGVVSDIGWYSYFAGRFEAALERCRQTLEIEPGYLWAEECVLLASVAVGDLETARTLARERIRAASEAAAGGADDSVVAALEATDPRAGLEAFLRWDAARLEAIWRGGEYVDLGILASRHQLLGEHAEALDWLEEAAIERASWILPFLAVHPLFDPLRDDPRADRLVRRVTGAG